MPFAPTPVLPPDVERVVDSLITLYWKDNSASFTEEELINKVGKPVDNSFISFYQKVGWSVGKRHNRYIFFRTK